MTANHNAPAGLDFTPRRVTVYCGSKVGQDPRYAAAAQALGQELVARKLELVTGGGSVGLMGVIADSVLAAGGRVIGVIPQALARAEVAHAGLSELYVVNTMHERKAMLSILSAGFVALPGGLGTLEELFEVATGSQLGFHPKPIGLLDVAGFYQPLKALLEHHVAQGFVSQATLDEVFSWAETPAGLLDSMQLHTKSD